MKSFKLVIWLNHTELLLRLTWKKIQIFMFNDSLVDVDAEKLNVVLSSTSGKENVVEEDDNHIEECAEADDNNSIEDEDENSD